MITVIHLDRSRSERVLWLCEELGLPYRVEPFLRGPDHLAPERMAGFHPLGRAPVILDGDTVLAESGAIVQYIIGRYGQGRLAKRPDSPDFARYLYWLHYAEGSLMLQLLRERMLDTMVPEPDALPGMAKMRETTRRHLALVEGALAASPYFAGEDFTAADIMMAYPFTTLAANFKPIDFSSLPATAAWVRRMEARPAFRKATTPAPA